MTNGYYKAICGFIVDSRLRAPQSALNTEQVRYEHRFMPFRNVIAPPPVPYIKFKERTAAVCQQSSSQLYAKAAKYFQQTKTLLETITDPNREVSLDRMQVRTNGSHRLVHI